MKQIINLVWIYKDFNIQDNIAIQTSCRDKHKTIIVYSSYKNHQTCNYNWWFQTCLKQFNLEIGDNLQIYRQNIVNIITILQVQYNINHVFYNKHWDIEWMQEEEQLISYASINKINLSYYYSNNIFNHFEIRNLKEKPYKRFGAFYKSCQRHILKHGYNKPYSANNIINCIKQYCISPNIQTCKLIDNPNMINSSKLEQLWKPGTKAAYNCLENFINNNLYYYESQRSFPAQNKTSKLSIYINYGVISIRRVYQQIINSKIDNYDKFIQELFWREFACYSLFFYPHITQKNLVDKQHDWIVDNKHPDLINWQKGATGVDIIDSSMRCLKTTGYLHNRLRMIVASFLVYDLNIHWLLGAKWFMKTLIDGDMASNSFNWQWISRTGFEIYKYNKPFNYQRQQKKFDSKNEFIQQWIGN